MIEIVKEGKIRHQEPCEDAVSRDAVIALAKEECETAIIPYKRFVKSVNALPSVAPKQRLCKDCKWWKDNDGVYRRGIEAESQCPINRKEVFEGNGYCYMFEPLKGRSE